MNISTGSGGQTSVPVSKNVLYLETDHEYKVKAYAEQSTLRRKSDAAISSFS
jgi:hypothetical protein